MAFSTLSDIRIKIRRLTRSPSPSQLSDTDIDNYVNTFILYDFPQHLRLFDQRKTLTFYAAPNIDTYSTNTADQTNPLFNFKNKYISVHPPVFIAGYNSYYTQSREQFFTIYPFVNNIASIGTAGNGVTTSFTGTLSAIPVLQNNVLFSSVDINNNGLTLIDDPVNAQQGNLIIPNNDAVSYGAINYITGAFNINFPFAPEDGAAINSQTVPYVPSRPQAILFYDDIFTLRPVPDQPYGINLEVYVQPTQLITSGDVPDITQWAQYICYGAARKVLQDRMDMDTLSMIEPEYKVQERLVLRKTLLEFSNERTATIYTNQTAQIGGNGFGWGGGNF